LIVEQSDVGAISEEPFILHRHWMHHKAPVHSVAMSPNSKYCASASWDASVNIYDFGSNDTKDPKRTLGGEKTPGAPGGLYSVAFAKTFPDLLGCTSVDKCIYLWNYKTGEMKHKFRGGTGDKAHEDEVNGIDFHSSQQVMVTAADDCQAIIWDFQEAICLRQLKAPHTKAVYGACFLGKVQEYFVATCSFDKKSRIFDMRDKSVVATLEGHTDDIIGIDHCEAGMLATGSDDGTIMVWDVKNLQTNTCLHKLNVKDITKRDDVEVKRVSFSKDGDMLAAACSSGQVVVVHGLKTGNVEAYAPLSQFKDCVFDVSWGNQLTPSGAPVLTAASHDHTVACWYMTNAAWAKNTSMY